MLPKALAITPLGTTTLRLKGDISMAKSSNV